MEEENKEYLESKVKDVMEPMIAQILLKRPKNVAKFMLGWLKERYNRVESSELREASEKEESDDVIYLIRLRKQMSLKLFYLIKNLYHREDQFVLKFMDQRIRKKRFSHQLFPKQKSRKKK